MCLEESFCPFIRDALNFRQPKIYAAPRSSVQVYPLPQPSSLRRVTLRSIILLSYRSCSVTAHACVSGNQTKAKNINFIYL